jgi:hypothetical protein
MIKNASFLLLPLLLFSCDQERAELNLELPETPVLSIEKYYAVVDFGFLRVRREPTGDSDMVTIIRGVPSLRFSVPILKRWSSTVKLVVGTKSCTGEPGVGFLVPTS